MSAPTPADPGPVGAADTVRGRVRRATLVLAALAGGTALSLGRQLGEAPLDKIWGEDGQIFLQQALWRGPVDAFLQSYNGYLHAVPRLLAEPVALAPLPWAAALLALEAALATAAVAVLVYVVSGQHITSRPVRTVLAAGVVLLPIAGHSNVNNIAYLHWLLLYASFWLLLWDPPTRAASVGATLFVLLTVLSNPLTVLLLPVGAYTALRRRSLSAVTMTATLVVGFAVQMVVADGGRSLTPRSSPAQVVGWYVAQVVAGAFVGRRAGLWNTPTVQVVALVAIVVVVGVPLLRAAAPRRAALGLALASSGLLAAAPLSVVGAGTRYVIAPILLVYAATALAVDGLPTATPRRLLAAGLAVVAAVTWTAGYPAATYRTAGPRWSAELRRACPGPAERAAVPITPVGTPTRWTVSVPCRELADRPPAPGERPAARSTEAPAG